METGRRVGAGAGRRPRRRVGSSEGVGEAVVDEGVDAGEGNVGGEVVEAMARRAPRRWC